MKKCGITVSKMCTNILRVFLMIYPKVSQEKHYNFLMYLTTPPPHISDCQHVFFFFFLGGGMSLRHLDVWFGFIQKFALDLILVDMVPDYEWCICVYIFEQHFCAGIQRLLSTRHYAAILIYCICVLCVLCALLFV